MIEKRGDKYVVLSEGGKLLGEFNSRKEAEKRLGQIEFFKGDCQFYDFAPFSGDRVITDEGYLEVNIVATAVGVQEYDGVKPGVKIGLNRTADTVFNKETIDSFKGKPVTIGHDGKMINSDTHKLFSFGNVMGDAFPIDGKRLGVRLLVTDADTVRRIQDGELVGVSLGYTCNQTEKSGTIDGNNFSLVTDGPMIINHVTLLPASMPPRVKQARILDKQQKGISTMDEEEIKKMIGDAISDAMGKDAMGKMVSDAVSDAMTKFKADAEGEKEKAMDADAEGKKEGEGEMDAAAKADAQIKSDAAAQVTFDAQVNDAANLRAQVLHLCDAVGSSKTNTELLKDKLGDGYVNDDQAIGYLTASAKLDSAGRFAARSAFSDSGNKSQGGAKILSLDAISKLGKKEA